MEITVRKEHKELVVLKELQEPKAPQVHREP
jgi:hypothetical protein